MVTRTVREWRSSLATFSWWTWPTAPLPTSPIIWGARRRRGRPTAATIAFTSNRDGLPELYVMHADGSSVRRLTAHIGFNGRPAWSPDSSRIALGCELEIGNSGHLHDQRRRERPRPSDDGSWRGIHGAVFTSGRIAFVTERFGPPTIAVLDEQGTVRGVSEGTDPAWSPDGTRIAFTNRGDVFAVAAAGGTAVNLTNDALGYYGPRGRRMEARWQLAGRRSSGIPAPVTLEVARTTPMISVYPMLGVYVANADGSAHNLLAFGGSPDWFVSSPGRPLARLHASMQRIGLPLRWVRLVRRRWHDCEPRLAIWRWEPAVPDRRPITCMRLAIGTSSR